jgi:LacI family sucrose operon transcriptional repressor
MNINEIAKLAGVSRATISRFLNDGYVSEEKRKVIQEVIDKTGYKPSVQAQSLRRQTTGLIGVIIPRIQSESVSRMVAGISIILSDSGYQLLLANTQNDEKEELKYLKTFRKNHVDGIIFMGTMFSKAHFNILKELEVPIVILGQQVEGYSCVYQDDYNAAKEAVQLLMKKGNQIGYIGVTARDKAAGTQRKKGLLDELYKLGIKLNERYITEADFGMESGYEATKRLMKSSPNIDSLLCATDNIAVGALKCLHEMGKVIPDEVQLIGFGDNAISRIVEPSITTVHFYYQTSGEESARLLLEILSSGEDLKKQIKMGFRMNIQESTKNGNN